VRRWWTALPGEYVSTIPPFAVSWKLVISPFQQATASCFRRRFEAHIVSPARATS
jgi:hypothetical protein